MLKHLRNRVICFIYRGVGYLPLSVSLSLATMISSLIYRLRTRQVRVIETNLAIAFPALSKREYDRLTRKCIQESIATMLQIPYVWKNIKSLQRSDNMLRMKNTTSLNEIRNSSNGAVLMTPHLGNWELFGLYLATQMNLMILYKPHAIDCLRKMTEQARASTGARLATTDSAGIRSLIKHLRSGGSVGLLPDQIPSQNNGVFASFFNFPAYTSTLAGTLAERHQTPIYIGYALRREDHFELCLDKITDSVNDNNDMKIATLINQHIEEIVARCPEQYNWSYKRFRRCPEGTQSPYRNLK